MIGVVAEARVVRNHRRIPVDGQRQRIHRLLLRRADLGHVVHAGVGEHLDGRADELLRHHALALRVQGHALHDHRAGIVAARAANEGNLLADVHRTVLAVLHLTAVGQNPRRLGAGGLGPGANARLAQNGSNEPRHAGLAPRAVDHDANRYRLQIPPVPQLFHDARQQQDRGAGQNEVYCTVIHTLIRMGFRRRTPGNPVQFMEFGIDGTDLNQAASSSVSTGFFSALSMMFLYHSE